MIIDGIEIPDEKLIAAGWHPPVKRGRQRVADGDSYWSLNSAGYPVRLTDSRDTACADRFNRANYFHTKEEAEHDEAIRCAGVRIIDALRETEGDCEAVDWRDKDQLKYIVKVSHIDGEGLSVNSCRFTQGAPTEWYTTRYGAWDKVIKSHESDLQLWFGVEEG